MMLRLTRNTYQHGWIETRPSKKQGLVFVYRWRERKPDGGYAKRNEVIGPGSVVKTENTAWRGGEHRRIPNNSEKSKPEKVTIKTVIRPYPRKKLSELRDSTA